MIKMTEEDTFNRLRRTPLNEIPNLLGLFLHFGIHGEDQTIKDTCEKYGWTFKEIVDEHHKRYIRRDI